MPSKVIVLFLVLSLVTGYYSQNCTSLPAVSHGCCTEGTCCTDTGCCCDVECYKFGDCCSDINEINCEQPTAPPEPPKYPDIFCSNITGLSQDDCCTSGTCCTSSQACCCEAECFNHRDCCVDILDYKCDVPEDVDLQHYCRKYHWYLNCRYNGVSDGCCAGDNCVVNTTFGECCSCDQDCYRRGDCCSDITDIGCACNNTCGAFGISVCCTDNINNCHTYCNDQCYCDVNCHQRGDCCSDAGSPEFCKTEYCAQDSSRGFTWPVTEVNSFANKSCNFGRTGPFYRYCNSNAQWNKVVDHCRSPVISKHIQTLLDLLNDNSTTYEIKLTIVLTIIEETLNITKFDEITPYYPAEVYGINEIIDLSMRIILDEASGELVRNNSDVIESITQGVLEIITELLKERFTSTLEFLIKDSETNNLLVNIEAFAKFNAQLLLLSELGYKDYVLDNIKIHVALIDTKEDYHYSSNATDVDVNQDGIVEVSISNKQLKELSNNDSNLVIVNAVIDSIKSGLYSDNDDNRNSTVGSNVLSTQLFQLNGVEISTNLSLNLTFTTRNFTNATNPACAFWNVTKNVWSDRGIDVLNYFNISAPNDSFHYVVTCNSSHLTSFVVLVDAHNITDEIIPEVALFFSIMTYIGCTVSCIFLILSIIFLLMLGKELIKGVQFFIHFNLCIALLVGYFLFMVFVNEQVAQAIPFGLCSFIAAVLHYFFLAAFSWMLCEGIMLFLLLVIVFSSVSKRWYLFLLLGWGLPIFPVVITAGAKNSTYADPDLCWLDPTSGAIWGFIGPMIVLILINILFLVLSVRALILYHKRNLKDKGKKKVGFQIFKKTILGTVTLIPLLGVTWLVGILSVNVETYYIFGPIFIICSTLQGVLLFFINIIRNDKIRENMIKKCCPKLAKRRKDASASKMYKSSVIERNKNKKINQTLSTDYGYSTMDRKSAVIDENAFSLAPDDDEVESEPDLDRRESVVIDENAFNLAADDDDDSQPDFDQVVIDENAFSLADLDEDEHSQPPGDDVINRDTSDSSSSSSQSS